MQLEMKHVVADETGHTCIIKSTDHALHDWAHPLESAFEATPALMHQYQTRHQSALDSGKQIHHFTLYTDSLPVCSLTLSVKDEIARLDDIGTDIEYQGRGYASCIIQHALAYAKAQGASQCFLEASAQGKSIYQKAGFSQLFTYTVFSKASK